MAAVLAGGPDAVLSHRSAAALWGLRSTARGRVEITVPRPRRPQAGIEIHRGRLAFDEVSVIRGIPVTTPPRTLLDLAAAVPRRQLERALDEAEVLRLTDPLSVGDMVQRHPRRRGTAALRAILANQQIGANITRSELERRFLAFLDDQDLPRPEVNAHLRVRGRTFEADCLWRAQHLIVELDGHATHGTTAAFERDRERDRILQTAEWRVVRVTWRQLHEEPTAVASDLRTLTLLPP
jgi:very-short-patch-repair endonuclease